MPEGLVEMRGIPVSPGVVIGKAFLFDVESVQVARRKLSPQEVEPECERFEKALTRTRDDIEGMLAGVDQEFERRLLESYVLMVHDPDMFAKTIKIIRENQVNAEFAFWRYMDGISRDLRSRGRPFFTERLSDLRDVAKRILSSLTGRETQSLRDLTEEVIVVAHDLSPSATATMPRDKVLGFVTDLGGKTSHTAIMARSLEIPAVVGLSHVSERVRTGDTIIVDGNDGLVILNPDEKVLSRYTERRERFFEHERDLQVLTELPPETQDSVRVRVYGNIEFPDEVEGAKRHGASGIGLFRTEFLYMNRADLPDEEEQYRIYRQIAEAFAPNEVTIRTLDLGGDKFSSAVHISDEINPLLGSRAIRFCLQRPDIFRPQLRAILRASAVGNIRMMYPMISGIEELDRANEILTEEKHRLLDEGIEIDPVMPLGIMIEVPSAALMADQLAQHSDFFSIGTNDLIQYTLAVDRTRGTVAHLYNPLHPSVIRLIRDVVEAGHRMGRPVAMCGEMAGEPQYTPLLLGLGLDELSMSPISIPEVKKVIRSLRMCDLASVRNEVGRIRTSDEFREYVENLNNRVLINGNSR